MTTTTLPPVAEQIAQRVVAGAGFLDQHRPGWDQQVVPHELEMADCHDCVLGQLFGHYNDAFRRRWSAAGIVTDDQVMPLGFTAYAEDDGTEAEVDAEYAELNAAWRELIETRRADS